MDNSLDSAIKKIKLQEQNKEAELKAKREFEAKKAAVERSIREVISQATKLQEEQCELLKKTDELRAQVTIQKIRRDALAGQLIASKKELNELEGKYDQDRIKIQEQRSLYCAAVQEVSDQCDLWPLLMKPTSIEPVSRPVKKVSENNGQEVLNEQCLKAAKEKRENAIAERERLLAEPEVGHEFVRKFPQLNYCLRYYCNKVELNENEPIKFSTSAAAQRVVRPVAKNPPSNPMPWYQPYVVVGSVTVFLVYFCVLREESDVDQEFNKTLYERIKGLEKEQLLQSYKFNKENGKEVFEIEQRLKEIEDEERKANVHVE